MEGSKERGEKSGSLLTRLAAANKLNFAGIEAFDLRLVEATDAVENEIDLGHIHPQFGHNFLNGPLLHCMAIEDLEMARLDAFLDVRQSRLQ